jgi:hypothetical protein
MSVVRIVLYHHAGVVVNTITSGKVKYFKECLESTSSWQSSYLGYQHLCLGSLPWSLHGSDLGSLL